MKYVAPRPFADPAVAARKLLEIANATEAVRTAASTSRRSTRPFLYKEAGTPAEYGAGLKMGVERGWLLMHESGTYVKFTQAGAELFA